jgi:hypothetical protein
VRNWWLGVKNVSTLGGDEVGYYYLELSKDKGADFLNVAHFGIFAKQ